MVTTRLFSPSELGKLNMFILISSVLLLFVPLGTDSSYLRLYFEPPNSRSAKYLMIDGLRISSYVVLLLSGICFIFKDKIINFIVNNCEYDILVLLFIYLISSVVLRFLNLTYRLENNAKLYNLQAILITFTSKGLYSLLGLIYPNHRIAIWTISIFTLTLAIIFVSIQKLDFKNYKIDIRSDYKLLKFGFFILPAMLLVWVDSSISRMIIREYMDFNFIGVYSAGVQFAALVTMISSGFSCFWAPFVYSNYDKEEEKIKNMLKYVTLIAILFFCSIFLFQDLIFLLIGDKYKSLKHFFIFLFVTPICYFISDSAGIGINIAKKSYWVSFISLISVSFNILISLMTVKKTGLLGIAIANAISGVVVLILRTLIGNIYYKMNAAKKNVAIALIVIISICFVDFFSEIFILKYVLSMFIIISTFFFYKYEIGYLLRIISKYKK
jgi:O-antigen/teichoic acid export membrane protein